MALFRVEDVQASDLSQRALGFGLVKESINFDPVRGAFDLVKELGLRRGSNFQSGRGGHRLQSEVEELSVRANLRNQGYQTPIELEM